MAMRLEKVVRGHEKMALRHKKPVGVIKKWLCVAKK